MNILLSMISAGDLKELYMYECEETPEKEDDGGTRFKKPKDKILAELLFRGLWSRKISKYHEVCFTSTIFSEYNPHQVA